MYNIPVYPVLQMFQGIDPAFGITLALQQDRVRKEVQFMMEHNWVIDTEFSSCFPNLFSAVGSRSLACFQGTHSFVRELPERKKKCIAIVK